MQVEVVVEMERKPVTVHGHSGSLIGLVEFADGTVGEYEAKDVRYVDHDNDQCI